ncbi:MAG: hypothetical protein HY973_00635 [Candidatus Kerfeldbacteria bacterium]|nr:hypothetical protein [Candidatus Kerfeldbacteria bacterium]
MPRGAIVTIYKPLGLTPLAALDLWRARHPEWPGVSMTYTGRLDPMAEGVVVVLIGEALKQQAQFQKQDKVYQATVLFGAETDTYDVLGIPSRLVDTKSLDLAKIKSELFKLEHGFKFKLPPYSSYKVRGKPLFWWALMNRLSEVEIPERTVKIYKVEYLNHNCLTNDEFRRKLAEKLDLVRGNFRQRQIKGEWQKLTASRPRFKYQTVTFRLHCQGGTYIRAVAKHLGDKFGCGAILWNLTRERVGDYNISQAEKVA